MDNRDNEMDTFFGHAKLMLAAVPLFVAALLSGCGSGCGTLGVANTSSCDSTTSSASSAATSSTFSISGTVSGGTPLGVTITLTGAGTGSTTTGTNGTYSFTALPNGSYNLVPSRAGSVFAPVSTAVTISGANVTATGFTQTANAAATYTISGKVNGPVDQNVLITLTSGSATTGTAVTDASGNYSFTVVAGTYTVTPGLTGYTFTPVNMAVTLSSSITTAQVNFTQALAQ